MPPVNQNITFGSPTLFNQEIDLTVWHISVIEESPSKKIRGVILVFLPHYTLGVYNETYLNDDQSKPETPCHFR